MKKKERKEYLYRILNINFMDEIFDKIKDKVKELKKEKESIHKKLEELSENDISTENISQLEISLEQNGIDINKCQQEKKNITDEIDRLNRDYKHQTSFLKTRKMIYKENRKCKNSIKKMQDEIFKLKPKMKIVTLKKKNKKITKIIDELQRSIRNQENNITDFRQEIEIQNKNLIENLKKIANDIGIIKTILEDVKNDKMVDKNQLNKINLDLITEISKTNDELNSKNSQLNKKIEAKDLEKNKMEKLKNKQNQNLSKQLLIKKTLDQIRKKKESKKEFFKKIKINEELLMQYRQKEIAENYNKNIENELKIKKENLELIETQNNLYQQFKFNLITDINKKKNILAKKDKRQLKTYEVNKDLQFFEQLLEITSVNGFSYYLLNCYIYQIEEKMNEVFGVYFNRKIKVILEKDAVGFKIINEDGKICSSMGGCESLLFELAFRISVAKTMKIPLCNTLFIDEYFFS